MTYSALITVFRKGGQTLRAIQVFEEMQASGVQPNQYTFNTLIGAWKQQKQWQQALKVPPHPPHPFPTTTPSPAQALA